MLARRCERVWGAVGALADPGQVVGREGDGPEIVYGEFELEGGEEAAFFVAFDAEDCGGDEFGAAIVVQHDALAGVKFHANVEQSAMSIHDLSFDFDADAAATREPRGHFQGNAQSDTLAASAAAFYGGVVFY
jgi:hypothetical protein